MDRFKEHFKMNEDDIKVYTVEKLKIFENIDDVVVSEIGDGNINYVFKAFDKKSNKSIVIKQADKLLRSSQRPLDIDRSRIEAEVMMFYSMVAKDYVPYIYDYDKVMCALTMEDISDCENLRHGLMKCKIYKNFAEDITTFMVNTLVPTMDIAMNPWEKKENVKRYTNIELCDITEKLVFTDPYTNFYETNIVLDESKDFVDKEIYKDEELIFEAGKLKYKFMNNPQSLIHGDLHSGSIFVNDSKTKVIDPEFAFYGPIGYDVGNVVGNLFFSYIYTEIMVENKDDKNNFLSWLEITISEIIDKFIEKFNIAYDNLVIDPVAKNELYKKWMIDSILEDTAGMAGTEIIRRTIGDSKVIEIESIVNIEDRVLADKFLILLGKALIKERYTIKTGKDYIKLLNKIKNHFKEVGEIF
ncbi:5-methylthioribose kinase [Acetoanaerobium pronyense]|uniref:S-methyl-5-thioribose kinase n=1 Tax=Acetoanaerobium pronyense TaxID=1482736 RepID=A0ABS4KL69_9FIRM|nr:S-methyl-5-thioribose kinase [Acetoanaerobium pronyense]MBP2028522.1 5-methylthioribose kinase [Acetoanaerobium pronyense]